MFRRTLNKVTLSAWQWGVTPTLRSEYPRTSGQSKIDDSDLEGDVEIMVGDSLLEVNSARALRLMASPGLTFVRQQASIGQFIDPVTSLPIGDAFKGRARLSMVDQLPDPRIGGVPGPEPLPVNAVAERVRSIYLSPATDLDSSSGRVAGELLEFESVWEPLGWAVDKWLSTDALAPGSDAQIASAAFTSESALQDLAEQRARDRTSGSTDTTAESQEAAHNEGRQKATSQGFRAGLSRQASAGTAVTFDPIAALMNAVTGAVQDRLLGVERFRQH